MVAAVLRPAWTVVAVLLLKGAEVAEGSYDLPSQNNGTSQNNGIIDRFRVKHSGHETGFTVFVILCFVVACGVVFFCCYWIMTPLVEQLLEHSLYLCCGDAPKEVEPLYLNGCNCMQLTALNFAGSYSENGKSNPCSYKLQFGADGSIIGTGLDELESDGAATVNGMLSWHEGTKGRIAFIEARNGAAFEVRGSLCLLQEKSEYELTGEYSAGEGVKGKICVHAKLQPLPCPTAPAGMQSAIQPLIAADNTASPFPFVR